MRTLLFGATLVTACLFPVTPVAAQCCGGAAQAGEHAAHAAQAPAPAARACCGDHQQMADKKAEKKDQKKSPAACCGAQVLPADDPAIAIAALGLSSEFTFGGPPAAQGRPAVR